MHTPIIFIIFNRPDTTQRVFEAIRRAKPRKLIVIADGPRQDKEGEKEKCEETRNITNQIDWDCEVIRDYSAINLGCKKRVSSGITSAFKLTDRAIILEDDCLPDQSFFQFCEEMLEKYKDNESVMSITGDNFLFDKMSMIKESYYFSKYSNIWGWATWKRAWDKYDLNMQAWPEAQKQKLFQRSWTKRLEEAYAGKIDTWDIQWVFSCIINNGLTIIPNVNLISNIGFSTEATHTKVKTIVTEMKTEKMIFPLSHPNAIIANEKADKISQFHFTRLGLIVDLIKLYLKK